MKIFLTSFFALFITSRILTEHEQHSQFKPSLIGETLSSFGVDFEDDNDEIISGLGLGGLAYGVKSKIEKDQNYRKLVLKEKQTGKAMSKEIERMKRERKKFEDIQEAALNANNRIGIVESKLTFTLAQQLHKIRDLILGKY